MSHSNIGTKLYSDTYQNVSLSDRSLNITNYGTTSTLRIHELHTNLSNISCIASPSKDTSDSRKFDWLVLQKNFK